MKRKNKMPSLKSMRDFWPKNKNMKNHYSKSLKQQHSLSFHQNDKFIQQELRNIQMLFQISTIIINLIYQMNTLQGKTIRSINKIYPPQLSTFNNRFIIYSPLQQWVQSHSQLALEDLIEIDNNSQPLYLNQANQCIILQSNREVFLQNNVEEWMKIQKSFKSQKEIISNTVQMKERFMNIDSLGRINSWKKIDLQEQENPESQEKNKEFQNGNYQTSETSLDMQNVEKNYENGYQIAEINSRQTNLFLLERIDDFKRIITLDTDFNGQSQYYQCYLPKQITYLYPSGKGLYAYGDHRAFFIDDRTQAVAFNLMQDQYDSISSLKQAASSANNIYVANRSKLQYIDLRKLDNGPILAMDLGNEINDFQFLEQKESMSVCVSFKTKSKVQIIAIQH